MKRNNYEITRLINYVKKASAEELMLDYGIEIKNGQVFDTVEEKFFPDIRAWAESIVGEDEDDRFVYGNKRNRFDDEDYY